ncbi:DeoR/GlpR family DNA-binding transcription regulator [Vibrio nigripulchritudo]|uniref:DeoR/GlpR family DNA-binding transcription regulator n=1 Tax=Vibrio nigripulchritudo TaxID=28173 RepID=UPI0003B23339|nr:DeoR/GlpR family DNA-binding transcription regulator [Vibrio nigripulchritudo]CCN86016.1 putative Glycerol-3-phosphate regulon repressor [Vibrio nigripulchritudo BLFn1]CCN97814.1 putative Glycerol-3-phosphate regulon repressor [Vibrio nigripulchritudo ENn2]CCO56125.1 putative Glycerol-3-phosphate regulon repressor [Vibrio nigripulchritudo Wn13]
MSQVRHQRLLEIVRSHGYASIESLAEELGCSQPTVRRDIKKLCDENRLQRFHGGVSHMNAPVRLGYETKSEWMSDAKHRIASEALRRIERFDSLFLDTGTTCDQVAKLLKQLTDKQIITHNLSAALTLAGQDNHHSVCVVGGTIRGADGSLTGAKTVSDMATYHADCAIVSASGLDGNANLLDFDVEKVEVKKAMMAASSYRILLLDSSKFTKRGAVCVGNVSHFDVCVTDRLPSRDYQTLFAGLNTELKVCK